MSVDGNWNITMSTPMGERNAALALQSSGSTLTGLSGLLLPMLHQDGRCSILTV